MPHQNAPTTPAADQQQKLQELNTQIAAARAAGIDFKLRGARQIALYRWSDEGKFKRVYGKERYPYTRHGAIFELSVATAERWERYLEFTKVHGLDPVREAARFGFGPPETPKKPVTPSGGDDGQSPPAVCSFP